MNEGPYTIIELDEVPKRYAIQGPTTPDTTDWAYEDWCFRHRKNAEPKCNELNEAYAAGLREGAQGIVKEGENKPVGWIRFRKEAEPVLYGHGEKKRLIELRRFKEEDFFPVHAHPAPKEVASDTMMEVLHLLGHLCDYLKQTGNRIHYGGDPLALISRIRRAYDELLNAPAPMEVKEGPSVEDIMEVVKAWRKQHDMAQLPYMVDDLRTRLSCLFTQTQVEPVAWMTAGNERQFMWADHRDHATRHDNEEVREFLTSKYCIPLYARPPQSPLVEQSEDAALPDGRLSDEEIDRLKWEMFPDAGGMRGSSERASEECERESWAKGLRYYRDHYTSPTT